MRNIKCNGNFFVKLSPIYHPKYCIYSPIDAVNLHTETLIILLRTIKSLEVIILSYNYQTYLTNIENIIII